MDIQRNESERYTFQDYLQWDDGKRYEIIDGEPILLAAPGRKHQGIVSFLTTEFNLYLRDKNCKVYPSPFSVRFSETDDFNEADNVFEPDFSIVRNPSQLDEYGCKGAPDLVVEVLSPSTSRNDRVKKYNTYQRYGVKEYWIIDPYNETVEIYSWHEGTYQRWNAYGREDTITSRQFSDLSIIAEDMFSY
ncbi:Uma2 family endonuclease [Neobacillus sp. PS3-12]|uniref:Uma2 family endonuclease n=1 Tax=Neobacillus sp. PS3-12 TaxID=3070677 RepID=UPI0027DEF881|nr:Uma2 family endonuclease [Neobacillus sp. PS3-12]WML55139.1 Uma2 family endonuclease [Neobacillus sp. PS3-12]